MTTQLINSGRVYRFKYNGRTRIALIMDVEDQNVICWDFTSNGYRRFNTNNIVLGSISDVTDRCVITEDLTRQFGPDVKTFVYENKTFAVRYQ